MTPGDDSRATILGMRDFRKLIAWQKAHALALAAHRLVIQSGMPAIASPTKGQLLRAVASIPANIAEGCGKRTDGEFARYLDIALGSLKEVENHLIFAHDMHWLDATSHAVLDEDIGEVRRVLFAFARSVRQRAECSHASKRTGREEGGVAGSEG